MHTKRVVKQRVWTLLLGVALTYASLFIPRTVNTVCSSIGTNVGYCDVVAGGFPLAYLVDNPAISPVGSIERSPLFMLAPTDTLDARALAICFVFWILVAAVMAAAWRGYRNHRTGS